MLHQYNTLSMVSYTGTLKEKAAISHAVFAPLLIRRLMLLMRCRLMLLLGC